MKEYELYKQTLRRIRINNFRHKLKQKSVDYKGGKCSLCGYDKNISALQFHHKDPEKKDFSISKVKSSSWKFIKPELDKCILLCSNCHSEIHAKERDDKMLLDKLLIKELSLKIKEERECTECGKYFKVKPNATSNECNVCLGKISANITRSRIKKNVLNISKKLLEELIEIKPIKQIAKELNCAPSTIDRRCKEFDLKKKPQYYWTSQICSITNKTKHTTKINWPSDDELATLVFHKPLIGLMSHA
jgi:hypothetical protein